MEVTVILKAMEASRQSRFSTGDHRQLHSFSTHTHTENSAFYNKYHKFAQMYIDTIAIICI